MDIFTKLKRIKKTYKSDVIVDSFGRITTKTIKNEREDKAKQFWKDIATTERILGRKLTTKEQWKIMQRGEWRCVCCGDILIPSPKNMVRCETCYLRLKLNGNKIDVIGNME